MEDAIDRWVRAVGKWLAVALVASAGLGVEVAPTFGVGTKDTYARLAAMLVAHSSCVATLYGDAQRIGGRLARRDDARDASCEPFADL